MRTGRIMSNAMVWKLNDEETETEDVKCKLRSR